MKSFDEMKTKGRRVEFHCFVDVGEDKQCVDMFLGVSAFSYVSPKFQFDLVPRTLR